MDEFFCQPSVLLLLICTFPYSASFFFGQAGYTSGEFPEGFLVPRYKRPTNIYLPHGVAKFLVRAYYLMYMHHLVCKKIQKEIIWGTQKHNLANLMFHNQLDSCQDTCIDLMDNSCVCYYIIFTKPGQVCQKLWPSH